ncbi:MAG: hypothetical protein Faunusvirus32_4 [Faunusvirus sp.]|jgi:ankyrin repeat protein|uniref:Ankyrin repeat protein n=1 Tax=Faunusvirus sp. TaxID=2487766 RepID=A0A3G4ZXL0_9VIRU|nr:MAG: hypothetical protein Faunusvirus32_4 [Faunusvirus sp.]
MFSNPAEELIYHNMVTGLENIKKYFESDKPIQDTKECLELFGNISNNINYQFTSSKNTPNNSILHMLTKTQSNLVFIALLHPNINVNILNNKNRPPVFYAERKSILKAFVKHRNFNPNIADDSGDAFIHLCTSGQLKIISRHKHINISALDHEGKTVMHGQTNVQKMAVILSLPGFNYTLPDSKNVLPMWSLQNGIFTQTIEHIILSKISFDWNLRRPVDGNPLLFITGVQDTKILLDDPNVDVNIQNNLGNTILHYTGLKEKIDLVLEREGVNVNIRNKLGLAPFCDETSEKISVIRSILVLGHPEANVNIRNFNEEAPLHYMINIAIVKKLLAHPDIDPNARDRNGQVPLQFQCPLYKFEMLIAHKKIDFSVQDNLGGNTILHLLCRHVTEPVRKLELLLKHDGMTMDILNIMNNDGKTAYTYFEEYGSHIMMDMLVEHLQRKQNETAAKVA